MVISVANLDDMVAYLEGDAGLAGDLDRLRAYRARYGTAATPSYNGAPGEGDAEQVR